MNKQDLEKTLYFQNSWWQEKRVPKKLLADFTRPVFGKLKSYVEKLDRIIVIKGPRRTGKTTLMYQFIESLLKENSDPFDILFVSFDDPLLNNVRLEEIFSVYEEIRRKTLDRQKVYCFLDEVHFADNWQLYVKKYFDRKYPIKFIISSSSASLFVRGLESLAGRTIEEIILPFSFKEFVLFNFRNDKNFLDFLENKRIVPYEKQIKILFNEYFIKGGFPHIIAVDEPVLWAKILREDVLEKVIYRDLTKLYGIREPQKMEKMFIYLADTSAQIMNLSNLSKVLSFSRVFTENYLTYLEQSYLVFKYSNFSLSAGKKIRSSSKVYLIDSGLISVFGQTKKDFILESIVAGKLLRDKDGAGEVYYYRDDCEIDFIVKLKDKIVPIEVKNKSEMGGDDFKNMANFMKENRLKKGIVVSSDYAGTKEVSAGKIEIIPAWKFLLFGENYL